MDMHISCTLGCAEDDAAAYDYVQPGASGAVAVDLQLTRKEAYDLIQALLDQVLWRDQSHSKFQTDNKTLTVSVRE